jgi:hypothetical protein
MRGDVLKFQRICDQLCPADDEAAELYASMENGDSVEVTLVVERRRTGTQNNCMWKWCAMLADALNAAGYNVLTFPWKEGAEIDFDKNIVNRKMWVPVQEAMTGHTSTKDPTTVDYQAIYAALSRHFAEKHGLYVPEWPSKK